MSHLFYLSSILWCYLVWDSKSCV